MPPEGACWPKAMWRWSIRSQMGFALVLGPKLGVALNTAGGSPGLCAGYCDPVVSAGTYFFLFRLGLGFNL